MPLGLRGLIINSPCHGLVTDTASIHQHRLNMACKASNRIGVEIDGIGMVRAESCRPDFIFVINRTRGLP